MKTEDPTNGLYSALLRASLLQASESVSKPADAVGTQQQSGPSGAPRDELTPALSRKLVGALAALGVAVVGFGVTSSFFSSLHAALPPTDVYGHGDLTTLQAYATMPWGALAGLAAALLLDPVTQPVGAWATRLAFRGSPIAHRNDAS